MQFLIEMLTLNIPLWTTAIIWQAFKACVYTLLPNPGFDTILLV